MNYGEAAGDQFSATLVKLTSEGVIGLVLVEKGYGRGEDFVVSRGDRLPHDPIDEAAYRLLFDVVAPRGLKRRVRDEPEDGWGDLRLSDMRRAAGSAPATYAEALDEWRDAVAASCDERGFFENDGPTGREPMIVFTTLLGVVGVAAALVPLIYYDNVLACVVLLAVTALACVVGGVTASQLRPLSSEAIELRARLEALRRWLLSIPASGEGAPSDPGELDQLLAAAVALGVAPEVSGALLAAMPAPQDYYDDDDWLYWPCYWWYLCDDDRVWPGEVVDESYRATMNAGRSGSGGSGPAGFSDGGGGGGGFSSGGGGGGGAAEVVPSSPRGPRRNFRRLLSSGAIADVCLPHMFEIAPPTRPRSAMARPLTFACRICHRLRRRRNVASQRRKY